MKKLFRLNIGAGRSARQPGVINADLFPGPDIDVVFDACGPWPFADASIGVIHANHSLEHLPEPLGFFKEAWRVLAPSQMPNLYINVPYGPSEAGFGDVTHLRQYVPTSFGCFEPGYNNWARNPQHDSWKHYFSVMRIQCMVDPGLRWLFKPLIRRWGLPALRYIYNAFNELQVTMRALKTQDDVDRWQSAYSAGVVPVAYAMLKHNYEGRALRKDEAVKVVFFGAA